MMDDIRVLIDDMKDDAQSSLVIRNSKLEQFSIYTPILIVFTSLLAIVITTLFFFRLKRDLRKRIQMERALTERDADISRRIDLIQDIAGKIARGEYHVRIKDEDENGPLGSLAISLNSMAANLERSFERITADEWLQKGVAGVNEFMVGERDIQRILSNTLNFIAEFTESQVGAIYLTDHSDELHLKAGYAFDTKKAIQRFRKGDGIVGQCALSGKELTITDIPEESIRISYATGEIKPVNIAVFPVYNEYELKGVLEIGSKAPYTVKDLEFLRRVCPNLGVAISSAENHLRLQVLLEETQSQSEELQSQHSELENLNSELEAQTMKLQASEEELRVQQEELREANEELEQRNSLLEEKNQVILENNQKIKRNAEELALMTKYKSEFLANMSHELRTPLNSILLLSRLLSENNEKNLTGDQVEYARVISTSGNSLLQLIDEILDLSRIEAGKMQLGYQKLKLTDLKKELLDLFQPMAKEKRLEFDIEIEAGMVRSMDTDPVRLSQVLKNLIANALKFTEQGSIRVKIYEAQTGMIGFTVRDTGIGIGEDKQKLIFEAFRQADGTTRRRFGGTGLGLSISREITRLLGGDIRLESKEGEGSAFHVIIPVSRPQNEQRVVVSPMDEMNEVNDNDKPDEVIESDALSEKESGTALPARVPEEQRFIAKTIPDGIADDRGSMNEGDEVILIIEDDTNFARTVMNYSRSRGYKVITTVRGDEALPLALHYKPKAILLDIVLPVKDGWEVMDELKKHPSTRHIPVHVMSSMDAKRESLVKGAVDFISKPFAVDQMKEVFASLERALTRDRKKVVILEENTKHAEALSFFLSNFDITCEIVSDAKAGAEALKKEDVDCVLLDMDLPAKNAFDALEAVNESAELSALPIIMFTGKTLSASEERKIREYADSVVVKTAHSFQRILDEVGLFLHLVEERTQQSPGNQKMVILNEVLEGKKVLVADDDVRNIFSVTKILEQHKMNVISAVDGKEAIGKLEQNQDVDIVLMDMMMPEMDGYEAIERIRKHADFRGLPILAVTAKAMPGDREKCMAAGASDYISKPIDSDQLTSLLRVWLYSNAHRHSN